MSKRETIEHGLGLKYFSRNKSDLHLIDQLIPFIAWPVKLRLFVSLERYTSQSTKKPFRWTIMFLVMDH